MKNNEFVAKSMEIKLKKILSPIKEENEDDEDNNIIPAKSIRIQLKKKKKENVNNNAFKKITDFFSENQSYFKQAKEDDNNEFLNNNFNFKEQTNICDKLIEIPNIHSFPLSEDEKSNDPIENTFFPQKLIPYNQLIGQNINTNLINFPISNIEALNYNNNKSQFLNSRNENLIHFPYQISNAINENSNNLYNQMPYQSSLSNSIGVPYGNVENANLDHSIFPKIINNTNNYLDTNKKECIQCPYCNHRILSKNIGKHNLNFHINKCSIEEKKKCYDILFDLFFKYINNSAKVFDIIKKESTTKKKNSALFKEIMKKYRLINMFLIQNKLSQNKK